MVCLISRILLRYEVEMETIVKHVGPIHGQFEAADKVNQYNQQFIVRYTETIYKRFLVSREDLFRQRTFEIKVFQL